MVNPIEIIKQGIKSQDWTLICKAYKLMSGETLYVENENKSFESELLDEISKILRRRKFKYKYSDSELDAILGEMDKELANG